MNKRTDYLFYAIAAGIVLMTLGLIIGEARGQSCYIDPVTGRRVCPTGPQVRWQSVPQAVRQSSKTDDVTSYDLTIRAGGQWQAVGVPVQMVDDGTLIATCFHLVRIGGPGTTDYYKTATVTNGKGETAEAQVMAVDPQSDVAILYVPVKWRTVALGKDPAIGERVVGRGMVRGTQVRIFRGTVAGQYVEGGYYTRGESSQSGDSGGGVYSEGYLVGINWGGGGSSSFAPVSKVRQLLANVKHRLQQMPVIPLGPKRQQSKPVILLDPDSRTTPAPPQLPATPSQLGACGCREQFAAVERQLAELKERQQALEANAGKVSQLVVNIDQSIDARIDARVDQRIAEIKFPECPAPTDTSGLELRINTLEAQLAELRRTTPVTWDIVPKE